MADRDAGPDATSPAPSVEAEASREEPAIHEPAPGSWADYWFQTRQPMQSLLLVLPIVIGYELGHLLLRPTLDVAAYAWVLRAFEVLGFTGRLLAPIAVVAALVGMHVARSQTLRLRPTIQGGMLLESLVYACPLLVLNQVVVSHRLPLQTGVDAGAAQLAADPEASTHAVRMLLGVGAGVYEELLFRLVGLAGIHAVLSTLVGVKRSFADVAAIAITSIAFALYHYHPDRPLNADAVLFYTVSGAFLAAVYLQRGFGVAALTHAAHNVAVEALRLYAASQTAG